MRILNELYEDLENQGVYMFWGRYGLKAENDAVVINRCGDYAIFLDAERIRTCTQEKMAIGHEWAHIQTDSTYSVDTHPVLVHFAECHAYRTQIKKLLPFKEMKEALWEGCCSIFDLAEHFNVTEDFVNDAIKFYTEACGLRFDE